MRTRAGRPQRLRFEECDDLRADDAQRRNNKRCFQPGIDMAANCAGIAPDAETFFFLGLVAAVVFDHVRAIAIGDCAHLHGCALRPGGVMGLQSITMPDDRFEAYRKRVDWMQTYIFPGSLIPSVGAIRRALAGSGLALDEAASLDIGPSYAPTLRAWTRRFSDAGAEVRALGFDAPFQRTWLMYLAFSEAAFAERTLGDHQLILRKA